MKESEEGWCCSTVARQRGSGGRPGYYIGVRPPGTTGCSREIQFKGGHHEAREDKGEAPPAEVYGLEVQD